MYGVREYSNLILNFLAEGSFTMSSVAAVTNFIPSFGGGGFPGLHTLQQLLLLECLAMAMLTGVM